ncbi:MAG: carbohydrate-binding module family 20 domain-containing protein [Candidatus Krumholzibacteriia bacterium]
MKRVFMTAAALAVCLCLAGNAQAVIGWAGNAWPNHGANVVPTGPVDVFAQVWKSGVTDLAGQGAGITAELRYTTDIAATQTVAMTYNGDIGSNDEYTGQIPQAALVGASWVDVTVVFTDQTDATTFEITGDQAGNAPPLRYNVVAVLPNDVDVVFTLCMSGTATMGPPCVIGSAPEIGTWGTGVNMTNIGGELWQVTVTFAAGGNPGFEYKYKKDACASWEGAPNRVVALPTDGTTLVTLATDSWDNLPIGCGLGDVLAEDKTVCFQVCLEGVVNSGDVCVTGSVSQLTNWGSGALMALIGPDLYEACITFAQGTPIPVNVEYKFRKDGCVTWESVPNRMVTIDNGSPTAQTLAHAWDDGASTCVPVAAEEASWSILKSLYR